MNNIFGKATQAEREAIIFQVIINSILVFFSSNSLAEKVFDTSFTFC